MIFQVTGVARAQDANTYVVLTPDDRSYLFHTNGQSVDGLGRGPLVTVWLSADRDGNYKLEQVKWKQENQTPGALPRLR